MSRLIVECSCVLGAIYLSFNINYKGSMNIILFVGGYGLNIVYSI